MRQIYLLIIMFTLMSVMVTVAEDELPLLPEDHHVGTMFYGWGAPPSVEVQPRIDDALAAGMNAYTVYLDWITLEPTPGNYQLAELEATLDWASENGLTTFANITVIDIESLVMPPQFLDGTEYGFAPGYGFANEELVARFLFMLDELVPMMVEKGVFYLGVGNEVDGWLDQNPEQLGDYLAFIAAVREHVQGIAPELAVGVTVTGNVPLYNPDLLETFYLVADVVSANIYGIDITDFTVTDQDATIDLLEAFLAPFDDRPVIIPELGCPSAESMNSSPEIQRACFETMFGVLADYDNVRFVTVFTFHDFDPPVCEAIRQAFGYDAGFETIYDERIADYLCTLGVVEADGRPKPAFEAFLDGIRLLRG